MSPKLNFVLMAVIGVLVLARMSVFVVDEREHALKFQFGEIVQEDYQPGLHFKMAHCAGCAFVSRLDPDLRRLGGKIPNG